MTVGLSSNIIVYSRGSYRTQQYIPTPCSSSYILFDVLVPFLLLLFLIFYFYFL